MTLGNRIAVSFVAVLAVLFGIALCGYLNNRWSEEAHKPGVLDFMLASAESRPEDKPMCMDELTRERVREAMMDGLDQAFREHVVRMFEVMMRDERGQPERARTGVKQGMRAYLTARQNVAEWMPPTCPG